MARRLLEAAVSGSEEEINLLLVDDPTLLLGTTPQGNTCLHIASIHGHQRFCEFVLTLNQCRIPLVEAINGDGETPLLTAVARGRTTLASVLLRFCHEHQLSETILKRDKRGFNALDHAICSGHRELALELIQARPALSQAVNNNNESPMYRAVMRNYGDVLEKLLVIPAPAVGEIPMGIPAAAHGGPRGCNALHAAVTSGNAVMAVRVMEALPQLARQENEDKRTPMHLAAKENKIDVLTALLQHDPSLGYVISSDGFSLLCTAAIEGNVGVAREFVTHCPDAPYYHRDGRTCLHIAVSHGEADFVKFVMRSRQLQHLINMPNDRGETALHLARRTLQESNSKEIQTMMKSMIAVLQIHAQRITSEMEVRLVDASLRGQVEQIETLLRDQPDRGVLLGTTPQGNTCVHIAAIHGHEGFCEAVLARESSLLAAVNSDGETPLIAAVASHSVSVNSAFFRKCCDDPSETILKQDKRGCNVLHHAIRSGDRQLALRLIERKPALSHAVNQYGESPMFMAVMRNYDDVFNGLMGIDDSAHGGVNGENALHAAVRNNNSVIAESIMQKRPALAATEDDSMATPLHLAVIWDKSDVLRVLLNRDRSLGYVFSSQGIPLLVSAAHRGHVGVAQVLLQHCPDAPFTKEGSWTCLHQAVSKGQMEFVDFILGLPQFRRLINMRNSKGHTALHLAVEKCNPKMVAALLHHPDIDVSVLNNDGISAIWKLSGAADHSKTLNWNEVSMLMMKAYPQAATNIDNLRRQAQDEVTERIRKDIKSLTQTYTSNTSLVAILIATITFAAAFTLPGGYSTDPENEGHPIMARKYAFKAFLIFDTVAMCCSLAVAFVCVIAKWEDLEFLLYYRSFTKKLMWFAYMATTTAFATGLYTILAPRFSWLAVAICILTSLLPILITLLLGQWPTLKLRCRFWTFNSELLDMV